jgi:hypothetical protein
MATIPKTSSMESGERSEWRQLTADKLRAPEATVRFVAPYMRDFPAR